MKIESGKRYVTRDGRVTGIVSIKDNGIANCEINNISVFADTGFGFHEGKDFKEHEDDLISEYVENKESSTYPRSLELKEGRYYRDAEGEVHGPLVAWSKDSEMPFSTKPGFCPLPIWSRDGTSRINPSLVCEMAAPGFVVETGKHYELADGRIVGPTIKTESGNFYVQDFHIGPDCVAHELWEKDGLCWIDDTANMSRHIVREHIPDCANPGKVESEVSDLRAYVEALKDTLNISRAELKETQRCLHMAETRIAGYQLSTSDLHKQLRDGQQAYAKLARISDEQNMHREKESTICVKLNNHNKELIDAYKDMKGRAESAEGLLLEIEAELIRPLIALSVKRKPKTFIEKLLNR